MALVDVGNVRNCTQLLIHSLVESCRCLKQKKANSEPKDVINAAAAVVAASHAGELKGCQAVDLYGG